MAVLEEFGMQSFKIRCIIIIGVMIIFTGVILWIQYKHPVERPNVDISRIPLSIGDWQGEEIPIEKNIKDILETDAVLMRKYSNIKIKGQEIILAIVYYKDNRVALHLPESCLSGQGSRLTERGQVGISIPGEKDFLATKIITTSDRGDMLILYYFETGGIRTNSYQTLRWHMLKNKLKLRSNSGALVRFSAPIKTDKDETLKTLKRFITEAGPVLSKYLY